MANAFLEIRRMTMTLKCRSTNNNYEIRNFRNKKNHYSMPNTAKVFLFCIIDRISKLNAKY